MNAKKGFLNISDAPFLRLLLPFIAGIVFQYSIGGYAVPAISAISAALFLIRYYTYTTPRYKYSKSKYFGYAIFAIFAFAGSLNIYLTEKRINSVPPVSAETAIARLTSEPLVKEQSIMSNADIMLFGKLNGEKSESDMPVILFFQTDSLSRQLKQGDIIIFKEKLQPVAGNHNPYGYDYRETMRQKGYVYSQYLPAGNWEYIGHGNSRTISETARHTRDRLIERIESLNLKYRPEALVKALIAGDTAQITQSMRTSYSIAGLSHILAVSGLHTGIIAFIIYLLLTPLKYMGARRVIPFVTVIATWGYIYIAGMPSSAVRAGIMATLVLIGDMIGRRETTINALLASAFLMLLYNPRYIFDVGFQLSYTAVFSIFYLYPLLMSAFRESTGIKRRLCSVAAVTIAAQVGTLPLCIYYFHQLPLLGIVSNMIVIPLLPFVMGIAILALLLKNWFLVYILDTVLSWINSLAVTIEAIPFSFVDGIYVKPYYVIFLMAVIFGAAWGIRTKRSGIIAGLSCFIFVFTAVESINRIKGKDKYTFAIYDDDDITAINMISPWYNYVVTPGITSGEDEVKKIAGTFWVAEIMPDAVFVTDSIVENGIFINRPYMVFGNEKIVILDSDRFSRYDTPDAKLAVNKVIVTWGFNGEFSKICELFDMREVIIASNVPWYVRNNIQKICDTQQIPCYDIKREGAYIARFDFKNRR